MTSYQPHKPGEAPKPDRDRNGVQAFATKPQPDTCPPGMQRDPATGECVVPPEVG